MPKKPTVVNPKTQERLRVLVQSETRSQREFAEKVGLSLNTVSDILTGDRGLTEDAAARICAAFPDVQISWLRGESDYRTQKEAETAETLPDDNLWARAAMYLERRIDAAAAEDGATVEKNNSGAVELSTKLWGTPTTTERVADVLFSLPVKEQSFVRRQFAVEEYRIKNADGETVKVISEDAVASALQEIVDFARFKFEQLYGRL